MKKCITLTVLVLVFAPLFSQHPLAVKFGSSYEMVKDFLDGKGFISANFDHENEIIASAKNHSVTYFFTGGVLYKMELVKYFPGLKEAKSTLKAFRGHYEITNADVVDLETDKKREKYIALRNRELHEVSGFPMDKNTYRVSQVSMDLDRLPAAALSELHRDENFLAVLNK